VQVLGEVRHAGLVSLPAGSRVADALQAAGGLVRGGGSGGLNLARLVVDGEQIVVAHDTPSVAGPGGSSTASGVGTSGAGGTDAVVDLNAATVSDLDALPGVGPVMAGRILEWRTAHGRFASVDQLREISGIGARTFARLQPHVRV
jgi:competence protein ComEA